MKEISCINQKFSLKTVVSDDLTAIVMKSGDLPVLATPAMIALMELTSKEMIKDYLDDDETTVGININVSHLKASLVGDVIETVSELIGVDKRKLTFSVKALVWVEASFLTNNFISGSEVLNSFLNMFRGN